VEAGAGVAQPVPTVTEVVRRIAAVESRIDLELMAEALAELAVTCPDVHLARRLAAARTTISSHLLAVASLDAAGARSRRSAEMLERARTRALEELGAGVHLTDAD
jgi:hypothetical protein